MTKMTEKQHDAIYNEGADGYNPIREARLRREREEEQARPVTLDDLYRQLERLDCSLARESGTYNEAKVVAIRAQIEAMKAMEQEVFAAIWTVEVTKARRIEWNGFIKSLPKTIKASDLAAAVGNKSAALGWSTNDLRRAVALHAL